MEKVESAFGQFQTLLMFVGGAVGVIGFILVGIFIIFSVFGNQGQGSRKGLNMLGVVALGVTVIGGAAFFAGLFSGLGEFIGQ